MGRQSWRRRFLLGVPGANAKLGLGNTLLIGRFVGLTGIYKDADEVNV
jgi:hypothetical protein